MTEKPGRLGDHLSWWAYRIVNEPLLAAAKDRVTETVLRHRPGRVLEVGCGTGWQAVRIARRGVPVTAVDLSDRLFPAAGSPRLPANLRFLAADGRRLPFAGGTFDLALASLVLHGLEESDGRAVLREMRRLLRPRGILLIVEFDFDPRQERRAAARLVRLFERMAGREHSRNSRRFLDRGGLPALAGREGLLIRERIPVLGGLGGIFELAAPR